MLLQFYDIVKMNTMKFMFRASNNLLLLICKYDIQLNYIILIYFIDLNL